LTSLSEATTQAVVTEPERLLQAFERLDMLLEQAVLRLRERRAVAHDLPRRLYQ
jgi:hypothetical protein